jgi:hypothetical protein
MQTAGQVKHDLLTALKVVTGVFVVAFCIPLISSIATVYNSFVQGGFLGTPMGSFVQIFLICLDLAFLAIVAGVAVVIVRHYSASPDSEWS